MEWRRSRGIGSFMTMLAWCSIERNDGEDEDERGSLVQVHRNGHCE